jgi:hypothetical protein
VASGSIFADVGSNTEINPQSIKANTGDGFDHINHNCGTYTSGVEVQYMIVEKNTADRFALFVRNDTDGTGGPRVEYEFSSNSIEVTSGSARRTNTRVLSRDGPNGGKLVQLIVEYDVSQSSDLQSGDVRTIQLIPDRNGNENATILHHHQLEEALNASSPIVTGDSPVTRSGDDYTIFSGGQPEWWNPNEGTIILKVVPRIYISLNNPELYGFSSGSRLSITNTGVYRLTSSVLPKVGSFTPYGQDKIAVSLTQNETIMSVNGSSDKAQGTPILSDTSWKLGTANNTIASYRKLIYLPRALPESTLNRITS